MTSSAEIMNLNIQDLNLLLASAINQNILHPIARQQNTRSNTQTEDTMEEHQLPPEYDTSCLNQKYFNDKMRSLMLRSSIARILDVTDVNQYIMKKDSADTIPFGQTVPTDTPIFGMLCMALDWLGVFKRGAQMEDKFMQLKAMFPKLMIFKEDIAKLVKKWADTKSKMFKKKNINRFNYKDVIRELANKGQFVSECLLLDTLMTYLEPTIVNIINGR